MTKKAENDNFSVREKEAILAAYSSILQHMGVIWQEEKDPRLTLIRLASDISQAQAEIIEGMEKCTYQ